MANDSEPVQVMEHGVRLNILVQPRASRQKFGPLHGDRIKVFVTSAPVDGAANEAVVALVAKTFDIPKRDVKVVAGFSSRRKCLELIGLSCAQILGAIQ